MYDKIAAAVAGHGLWSILILWGLREAGPKAWAWISTAGTDEAVIKTLAAAKKALKAHGATDAEVAAIEGKIAVVLARVESDVAADQRASVP